MNEKIKQAEMEEFTPLKDALVTLLKPNNLTDEQREAARTLFSNTKKKVVTKGADLESEIIDPFCSLIEVGKALKLLNNIAWECMEEALIHQFKDIITRTTEGELKKFNEAMVEIAELFEGLDFDPLGPSSDLLRD